MNSARNLELLERGWLVLSAPASSAFASFPLGGSSARSSCRAALDRAGHRHLLVPYDDALQGGIENGSAVLSMRQQVLAFDGSSRAYIDIECRQPELSHEFDQVCLDVLDAFQGPEDGAASTLAVITRWRRLFDSFGSRRLDKRAKLGLFAELSVYRALLLAGSEDVEWTGPSAAPHDFETERVSIEVKGYGASSPTVTVHGLAQLQPTHDKPLYLALIEVSDDEVGERIADVIGEIAPLLEERAASFAAAVGRVGYTPSAGEERFRVNNALVVEVDASTPRLTPAHLRDEGLMDGVVRLRCEVEIGSLAPLATPTSLAIFGEQVAR